ncbi:caspase family protein [Micromonospora sp. NPDC048905]|uniref:HD domain-containing protein n=1 Tax=Micromonospora sp. NPDC048905 TaxID=3155494 RepID=UPI0034083588
MSDRFALLIGVPHCDDAETFAPIPEDVVRADITRMRDALMESGYQVTVLGVAPDGPSGEDEQRIPGEVTRTRCLTAIDTVCQQVPAGGTLLLYFSGHGVRFGDRDYLVPEDYRATGNSRADEAALISLDLSDQVGRCQAGIAVAFIDACRDNPDQSFDISQMQGLPQLPNGAFALVAGCARGEICRYDARGSLFTRALADALGVRHSACTVSEVVTTTKRALAGSGQTPSARATSELTGTPFSEPVCDGLRIFEEWQVGATDTELWGLVEETASAKRDPVAAVVRDLVEGYANTITELRTERPHAARPRDPWTDEAYPQRVLSILHALLRPQNDDTQLTLPPAEVAVLVIAPYLREAVLALGMFDLHRLTPRNVRPTFQAGLRFDLEVVYSAYEQLCRRVIQLEEGSVEQDAIVTWMAHRWLLGREDLWCAATVREWTTTAAGALLGALGETPSRGEVAEYADLLLSVAHAVGGIEAVELIDTAPEQRNSRVLARLVRLAGVLAADPRRVPQVVPDHIGVRDPVALNDLREVLATARWRRVATSMELAAVCPHPAIHVVLGDLAAQAEEMRRLIVGTASRDEQPMLAGLPPAFTADAVHALRVTGQGPLYQLPLLRFSLAADKVQGMLMGSQLYGDRSVAIRELYQNALDACRYREMRFRAHYHDAQQDLDGWTPRVVFRQGVEATGRPYLECQDNGVGMTEYVITRVFAEAGTRFVQTEPFRREQARWQQLDPALRLHANSQFGIGVFSYFMLASEISITTVPTYETGLTGREALQITIAGNGNLFRVRRTPDVPSGIRNGGTIVRLHLSVDDGVSCAEALREHLHLPEYRVDVEVSGEVVDTWHPGELRMSGPIGSYVRAAAHVWWIADEGRYLTDGIQVLPPRSGSTMAGRSTTDHPFGFVLNMTGRHRPRISVDRREMLEWDAEWVSAQLRSALPTLRTWSGLSMQWLWRLAAADRELADWVFDELGDLELPVRPVRSSVRVNLGLVGCLPEDADLQPDRDRWPHLPGAGLPRWIHAWRAKLWRDAQGPSDGTGEPAYLPPDRLDGYPVIRPNHLDILPRPVMDAYTFRRRRDTRGLSSEEFLRMLRPYVIAGLDLRPLRLLRTAPEHAALLAMLPPELKADENVAVPFGLRVVGAAWLSGRSVGEAWRALITFTGSEPMPSTPVESEIEPIDGYVPDNIDRRLVHRDFRDEYYDTRWLSGMSVRHLLAAGEVLGIATPDLVARVGRLRALGIWSAIRPGWNGTVRLDEDDPVQAWLLALERPPNAMDLLILASRSGESVSQVADRVSAASAESELSVLMPELSGLADITPGPDDWALLSASEVWDTGAPLVHRLGRIVSAVAAVAPLDGAAERLEAALARLAPFWELRGEVTPPMLVAIAGAARITLGEVRDHLLRYFAPHLDLDAIAAELPSALRRRTVRFERAWMLLTDTETRPRWQAPAPLHVVWHAHVSGKSIDEVLSELAPYQELGAILPAWVPDGDRIVPDGYDVLMLTDDLPPDEGRGFSSQKPPRHPLADNTVTPLHLLRLASRYGWEPGVAYDRLTRFQSLGVVVDFGRDDCPEGIVGWQDLIVLTEELDGWAPPLHGDVTAEQMALAAAAVGEPVDVTRARLCRYAALFGLRVPDPPEESNDAR